MGRYMLIDKDIRILEEKLQSIRGAISDEEYTRVSKRIEEIKNQGIELPSDASMLQANEIITQIVDLEFNNFSKEFMDEATKKSKREAFLQKLQYIASCIEKNEEVREVIDAAEAYWSSIESHYDDIEQRSVREKIDEIKLEATLQSVKRSGKLDVQDISLNQNYFLIRKRLQELIAKPDISEGDKLLINSWLGESVDIKSGEIDTKAMEQVLKTPKIWALLAGIQDGLQAVGQEYKSEFEKTIEEESGERKKEITETCIKYGISEAQLREVLEKSKDNVYIVQTLFGHKIVLEQDRIAQLKKSRRRDCKKNEDVRAIIYNNMVELIELQTGYGYIDPEVVIFSDNTVSIAESTFEFKKKLKSIRLPNKRLRSIGCKAFGHSALESLDVPDSVEDIGDRAFEENPIKVLTLGKGLRRIGRCSFFMNKLVELNIPGNVEEVGEYSFAHNPLASLTLQEGTKKIKNKAFIGSYLLSIVLPTTVADIGQQIAPEYTKIKQARGADKESLSKQLPSLEDLKREKLRLIAELEKIDEKIKDMELDRNNISIEK